MSVPRLLVSVRSVREAEAARRGGADIIDIKEPALGSLGMAPLPTIAAIVDCCDRGRPLSAALGELHERPLPSAQARADRERAPTRATEPCLAALRYVKLGLAHAPADWPRRLDAHLSLHGRERFIAVAYADHARSGAPPVRRVLDWAIERGVAGLLIDTAIKDGRGLLQWCELRALEACIELAHRHRLMIALAGSLDRAAVARLAPLGPDVLAVRGAACDEADRTATISETRIEQLKASLAAHSAASGHRVPAPAG